MIAPDLIGCSDASKSTDVEPYICKLQTEDLAEILDAEDFANGIAYCDRGSVDSPQISHYQPERMEGVITI